MKSRSKFVILTFLLFATAGGSVAAVTLSDGEFLGVDTGWSITAVSSDQGNGTLIPVTSVALAAQAGELNAEMVIGDHSDGAGGRFLAAAIIYDPGNPAHTALRDQLIESHQALQKKAPGWGFGPWDGDRRGG